MLCCAAVAAAETPIPKQPPADRSVFDLADVVDPAAEQAMESMHTDLFRKTGVAIVVISARGRDDLRLRGPSRT
jgi:uncharacterized membrane protein YgcG